MSDDIEETEAPPARPKVLVASTLAPYKCCFGQDTFWLRNAEDLVEDADDAGYDVEFFLALEQDARGDGPYETLLWRMKELEPEGIVWRFRIDDGSDEYTSENRLFRICTGRNAAIEYALGHGHSHIFCIDSDTMVPNDSISKMLELDRPVAGGYVPIYGQGGPRLEANGIGMKLRIPRERDRFFVGPTPEDKEKEQAAFEAEKTFCQANPTISATAGGHIPEGAWVEEHWNTAGFLLVRRDAFRKVRWGTDPDVGQTDDPWFQARCAELFGQTWVRHDLIGTHAKVPMVRIEERPRHDRTYHHEQKDGDAA